MVLGKRVVHGAGVLGLLLGLQTVLVPPARAQAPARAGKVAAKGNKKEQAEVHYDQGKAYYKAGAFDLAIQEFLAGYELDPRAGVLFNVARGYEELKDRDKAIEFYKKYIGLGEAATAATEARARIVVLERQIKDEHERAELARKTEAEERERKRQEALAAASAPPPPVNGNPDVLAPGVPDSPTTVSASATPASPDLARNLKLGGMVAGGVGVALVGAGVFFVSRASGLESDIKSEIARTQTWTADLSGKDSDMKSANTLAAVCLVTGGVAVVGGAALYYFGWREGERVAEQGATASLWPSIGPDGSPSLVLAGRF